MERIRRITGYKAEVPIKEGSYNWSGGHSIDAFDTTFVAVETAGGVTGWGEVTPLGPSYLPAYAAGARTGIAELAPGLIGLDALALEVLNRHMDTALLGHAYVKSAIDMACWDILGQVAGLPVCVLMGGRFGPHLDVYRSITRDTPEAMAERIRTFQGQGYKTFQLKVGSEPDIDIERIRQASAACRPGDVLVADANTGWLMHQAARVVRGVRDIDVHIEQPCRSYEECLAIRRRTDHPFILDESIDSVAAFLRADADRAMDTINLKISKLGGLTRARQLRDLCVARGVAMTIEDSAGSDVAAAAVTHLAHSTPEEFRFSMTIANVKLAFATAEGAPRAEGARTAASAAPGLGVRPLMDVLGAPIFRFE